MLRHEPTKLKSTKEGVHQIENQVNYPLFSFTVDGIFLLTNII